jgi:hypothetical protein
MSLSFSSSFGAREHAIDFIRQSCKGIYSQTYGFCIKCSRLGCMHICTCAYRFVCNVFVYVYVCVCVCVSVHVHFEDNESLDLLLVHVKLLRWIKVKSFLDAFTIFIRVGII